MADVDDLKEGDLVRLKSGGPKMTVDYVMKESERDFGGDVVGCSWFVKDQRKKDDFKPGTLEMVEEE